MTFEMTPTSQFLPQHTHPSMEHLNRDANIIGQKGTMAVSLSTVWLLVTV